MQSEKSRLEFFDGIRKSIEETARLARGVFLELPDPLKQIALGPDLSHLNAISDSVAREIARYESAMDQVARTFAGYQELGRRIAQEGVRFTNILERLDTQTARFVRIMVEMGWPPPGQIPVSLISTVVEMDERGELDREELQDALLAFFDEEELLNLVDGWGARQHLSPRLQILRAAVDAHIERKYELSVPAILPQIEGVVAEAFGHYGILRGPVFQGYVERLLQEDRPTSFRDATRTFFLNSVRAHAEFGMNSPEISRHAILHGIDLNYAEESKSLRIILLFDQVQEAIQYVATNKGGRYHRPHCSYLGTSPRGDRLVFVSKHEATRTGLQPCSRCTLADEPYRIEDTPTGIRHGMN